MTGITREPVVAFRGGLRWTCTYERTAIAEPAREAIRLREGGVYSSPAGPAASG